jgi:glycosyltransferase involved in cell wall biosynthesis
MVDRSPGTGARVWIVNHYAVAPDRPAAAGSRHFDLARRLVTRGDRVTIFAAGVSHLTGREERLASGRLYRADRFEGVRFVWLRTLPYRGNTWRRPLNMLTFVAAFLVVQTRQGRPDVVVGSTVHPFAAFAAWLAASLHGARFVLEIRDLWPQTLVDIGALTQGSPGERLLRHLEAFLVRRASVVITLLPGMQHYLDGQGLPADHVVYIPNGVDLGVFGAVAAEDETRPEAAERSLQQIRRLRDDGRFVLGYVGTFGRVNRVDVLVQAAAIAEQRAPGRIGLVLIGDGPDRDDVERLATGVPAVALGPAVAKPLVPAILRALDGTVVHATATPVYRYGISFNKLFEYMAVGRPVVFACESANDPVAEAGAGVTVAPSDPERIAAGFLELAGLTSEARTAMGVAGRAFVARHHDLDHLGEAFAAVVEGGPPADHSVGLRAR